MDTPIINNRWKRTATNSISLSLDSANAATCSTAPRSPITCARSATSNLTRDSLQSENKEPMQTLKQNSVDIAQDVEKKALPIVKQEDKSKCWNCTKKVGLLGYECQCQFTFCKKHRMPEDHQCTFDFVNQGKKVLSQNNPLIKSDKIQKI